MGGTVRRRVRGFVLPNADTIAAMREARRGRQLAFKSAKDLMADLHAED